MALLDLIKKAGIGAVEAGYPVAVMYGTVITESPLEVNVDQRLTLTEDFLLVPENLTAYELDLSHTHNAGASGTTSSALTTPAVIRRGLQAGDKVLLLRMQGGDMFVVLDRLVSP